MARRFPDMAERMERILLHPHRFARPKLIDAEGRAIHDEDGVIPLQSEFGNCYFCGIHCTEYWDDPQPCPVHPPEDFRWPLP